MRRIKTIDNKMDEFQSPVRLLEIGEEVSDYFRDTNEVSDEVRFNEKAFVTYKLTLGFLWD